MSASKSTFYRETKYGYYDECPDPSSTLECGQSRHCLKFRDERVYNIQIMSPVSATIASIEIKDPDYRNRTPVFITIHFDDGSILLGFFMNSGKYRENNKSFTQYDYFNYSETHVFHLKPEEGKYIDFFKVVNQDSCCFYEEYCWIFVSGGVVSLLKVDEDTLLNIFYNPMSYPHPYNDIFSISELDFSERLEEFGEVVGSCRIEASGRPVKITCDFQNESAEVVLTVKLVIFEANYKREQDGAVDGISCPEYREAALREAQLEEVGV